MFNEHIFVGTVIQLTKVLQINENQYKENIGNGNGRDINIFNLNKMYT